MFNTLMSYVFKEHSAKRVTGLIKSKNEASRTFAEHIGFSLEGVMRKAFAEDDLCVYGFIDDDYKSHPWQRTVKNG